MIHQIKAQVLADPVAQQQLEATINHSLNKRLQANLLAFAEHIPSLFQQFRAHVPTRVGHFCTSAGQLNLVDLTTGITFYGIQAETEARADAARFAEQAIRFEIATGKVAQQALPEQCGALMLCGLGSGVALETLLQRHQFEQVLVYEPNPDVFAASLSTCDWAFMLQQAAQQNTQLFLQIGDAALTPADDLVELTSHLKLEQLWLYRHTHHSFLDAWLAYLQSDSYSFEQVTKRNYKLPDFAGIEHALPHFSPQLQVTEQSHEQSPEWLAAKQLYLQNMEALAEFYPNLHEQLQDYEPTNWGIQENIDGGFNLLHKERRGYWYPQHPQASSQQNLADYKEHAEANDLAISYTGGKLFDYQHFKYSQRLGEILAKYPGAAAGLPKSIPALAVFMPALGYQLEKLVQEHRIHSLYVIEPNIEFFYWSLYTVPWFDIFADFQQREASLHFSIGDDGTYFEQDMIRRFSEGDGYLTANTYFYLPTPVARLQSAVNSLKREMKTLLVWAEYFDHVRYALAHNRTNFKSDVKLLDSAVLAKRRERGQKFNTPLFIVGNGPSLDDQIEHLLSIREQVLVVSCGTALKALWKYGIQPDFHAELEQNRVPFEIISSIQDPEYLKQITLLSVTTVCPEVSNLFKETWTVFKHGDGSSAAYDWIIKELGIPVDMVQHSFPTVSNLALDIVLLLGFRQIYLMGVDLGYASADKHHSKHSIYYNNKTSKELYNYKDKISGQARVRGNLRPTVDTQFQFKASADMMSRLLHEQPHQEVYNCSDGMFITGTMPLKPDLIMLEPGLVSPADTYRELSEQVFSNALAKRIQDAFDERYTRQNLVSEFKALLRVTKRAVTDEDSALEVIRQQQSVISLSFHAHQSLLFPLFASEMHLTHATLTRFLYAGESPEQGVEIFKEGLAEWQRTLEFLCADYLFDPMRPDETKWRMRGRL